jgi:hypothetical protein
MTRSIGIIMLVIFLAITGLLLISNFHFEQERFVTGITALAAAIFLAIGK